MINEIHHGRDISFSIFTAERKSFFVLSKWLVLLNNHTHVWYFLLTLFPENKKKRKSLTSSVKLSISEGYFYRRGKNRARFGKTSQPKKWFNPVRHFNCGQVGYVLSYLPQSHRPWNDSHLKKKKQNTKTTNLLELCMMNESMIASWKRKTEVPLLSLSADKPLSQF